MKKILVTGIVGAGILLGGASIIGASTNDGNKAIVKDEAVQTEQVVNTKNDSKGKSLISAEKAKEIALSQHDGYIDDIELDSDDGYTYYEVEIENGDAEYDIYIDAYTGDVLKVDSDDDYRDFEENKTLKDIISADEAKKIAINQVGGTVTELELDEDDLRYEYELELQTDRGEVEMTIDAKTGEILEQELDR